MKPALARNHAKAAPVLLFISKSSRLCNAIKLNFTVA